MALCNGKQDIRACLNSVKAQTFADWELLIVNGFGSDGGCTDVIRRYGKKDPRIILLQPKDRLGPAAALNYGLEFAKGEYIARVDADTISCPKRFEKQAAYMDAHPGVTACGVWQQSVVPARSVFYTVSEPEELKAAMMFGCGTGPCDVMLRLADMRSHHWRYDPLCSCEDFELWTRMLVEGAVFVNLPEVMVKHRRGPDHTGIAKGEKLKEEVSLLRQQLVCQLGINTDQYTPELFMGWENMPTDFACKHRAEFLMEGATLLQEIAEANLTRNVFEQKTLMKVLHQRWDWIRESCGISFKEYEHDRYSEGNLTPVVSVVLPSYNSVQDICRSIDSILDQTFTDWELLVVNDLGSDDGTAALVRMYSFFDSRIQLIQAKEERMGLAESLNTGIRAARGKYIARLDADDTSAPSRFEKQVAYLDAHPEIGVCGTWQRHYGPDRDWVHEAPADPAACKARLLFWCDLCHSTLMLRRNAFVDNDLYYDPNAYAEDFELWTRAMEYMEFANLPEVLGEYKEDGTSITAQKFAELCVESGQIVANTLRRIWGVALSDEDAALFRGWENEYATAQDRVERLSRLEELFRMIWQHNQEQPFFDNQELLQAIAAKWYWAKMSADWKGIRYNVSIIDDVFDDRKSAPSLMVRYRTFRKNNPSRRVRIKKIIKKCILSPFAFVLRRFKGQISQDA